MSNPIPPIQRLDKARELIREKKLSRQDLELLEEILRLGASDLPPMLENSADTPVQTEESPLLGRLRRSFGLFLAFLNQFSDRRLGEARPAMGLVIQHSLVNLGEMAKVAHRDLLSFHHVPEWVIDLLDLIASLRTMSSSLGSEDGPRLMGHWAAFLRENRDHFRNLFLVVGEGDAADELRSRLNQQMKNLNKALHTPSGRPLEHARRLEALLEGALPEATRIRAEPLLLVQHVISSLRMSLVRPLDRGIHWPAVENVRGSLQWLWNHLGWTLPRVEGRFFEDRLPLGVRDLLKQLRKEHPPAFLVVARALASHLALLGMVERMEPAANSSVAERYATVPTFLVVESELGRLAERVYHPRVAESLPKGSEESLLLGAFLRQAVLSLLQDQATIRGLLQQTLANNDVDQLANSLDNLRALLLSHQRQLMADLVGLFSPELRQRLFPDSPSLTEEGDRLRQRLHRLWEYLDPSHQQIQLHLELQDLPRLALALGQAQTQIASFRRSPEFLLIRSQDRLEFDRITQQFSRILDNPENIENALQEGSELVGELLRFLDVFLLRINARVPLIRLDLTTAREARNLCIQMANLSPEAPDRVRTAHKLIQTTKPLGVRDAQALSLLKRWVRSERGGREPGTSLESLGSHLQRLAVRLEAALD
ncbi:MAG: hypothetical protein Q8O00_02650 [Holophaga sp.]|nr:hypothetical protein [Holophaga sp.]